MTCLVIKKRKTERVRVSEEILKKAVATVLLDHISIREVSNRYPVKKSTLSRFVLMNLYIFKVQMKLIFPFGKFQINFFLLHKKDIWKSIWLWRPKCTTDSQQ